VTSSAAWLFAGFWERACSQHASANAATALALSSLDVILVSMT
jgi:hypothetical protein